MKVLWKMPVTVLNVCVQESIPLRWAGSINITCQSSNWTQNLKRQAIPHHTFKRNVSKSRSELRWGSCRTIIGAAELERCYFAKILNTSLREDLLITIPSKGNWWKTHETYSLFWDVKPCPKQNIINHFNFG